MDRPMILDLHRYKSVTYQTYVVLLLILPLSKPTPQPLVIPSAAGNTDFDFGPAIAKMTFYRSVTRR